MKQGTKFLIFFSTGLRLDFGPRRRSRFFEDALFVISGLFQRTVGQKYTITSSVMMAALMGTMYSTPRRTRGIHKLRAASGP